MKFVAIFLLCAVFACLVVAQSPDTNAPPPSAPVFRLTDALLVLVNILMIYAVYQAPKAAIKAQWELQQRQEQRNRRLWIFKTLMSTRATALDVSHVQALNLIDVEFSLSSAEDTEIRKAWKDYLDHLTSPRGDNPEGQRVWDERQRDFFAELMTRMGGSLGYGFDHNYVKTRGYYPIGLGQVSEMEYKSRVGWMEIVTGEKALRMEIVKVPGN